MSKNKLSGNYRKILERRKTKKHHSYSFCVEDGRSVRTIETKSEAEALYFSPIALSEYQRNRYELAHNQKELPMAGRTGQIISCDNLQQYPNEVIAEAEFERQQAVLLELLVESLVVLTPKQKAVVAESMAGKGQTEVAQTLGLHQTSVHKTLHGNIDYKRNKRYGGALHKIQQYIVARIGELNETELLTRLGITSKEQQQ